MPIFIKSNDMDSPEMINYSGIILSCYADNNTSCVHAIKDHSLIYTYAGKLLIEDKGKELTILPGECVFIRRDHRVQLTKLYSDTEQYKGITFLFRRNFLRKFYQYFGKYSIN